MDNIATLMQKISLPMWLRVKPRIMRPGLCSLALDENGFTLAYTRLKKSKIELSVCESVTCNQEQFPSILSQMVKEFHLKDTMCSLMLAADKYHLFSLEELPVAASEFQSAIRWNLKKLLPFPIEDAVIDSFSVPAHKIADAKKMITAVVAQSSYLQAIVASINASGLKLKIIDIPEFGFSHITQLYENDEMSTALIQLKETSATLIISRQKEFYLTRRLDWGLNLLINEAENSEKINLQLDRLALEIQRTFDYFQSQWRYPAPTRILLAPVLTTHIDIAAYLSERLAVKMQNVDLNMLLNTKRNLSLALQSRCLTAIGGSLRSEIKAHAEN